MTNITSLTDTYGVFTYKSPLIWFAAENFQNWRHRELAIKKDFFAKTYICKLDAEILAERPIFTPNIFGASSEETQPASTELEKVEGTEDVSEEWDLERWDFLLLKMMDMARTHAFCVVQLYDRKPYWKVFTDREIIKMYYDKNDNPIGCKVEWTTEMPKSDKLRYHKETLRFYKDDAESNDGTALFVPFGNPIGRNLGEYDLEHIWDLMIWLRYAILDTANNSAKSSGFYWLTYGEALTDTKRDDLLDAMDIAGGMRAVGAKESALANITAMYPTNAEFSLLAIDQYMLLMAGACRLPLSFFRGERETGGMNSGMAGYIDEAKITEKKKYIFSLFATFIKKLVEMRWGIIIDDVVPYIKSEQEPVEFESFGMNNQEKNNNFSNNND